MGFRRLPDALSVDNLEFAASDARNIEILACTAIEHLDADTHPKLGAFLNMISDLAQILEWNLNRMDETQRTARRKGIDPQEREHLLKRSV